MQASTPPAEAELFAKNIMSTYGRYPITMVKYAEFLWLLDGGMGRDGWIGLGDGRGQGRRGGITRDEPPLLTTTTTPQTQ